MTSPMRALLITSVVAAAALVGSCGKDEKSGGGGTTSDVRIHLGRELAAGDGARITMECKGNSHAVIDETDIETNLVLRVNVTQRCERRTADGGSILSMVIENYEVEGLPAGGGGAALDLDQFKNMKGTMTVGPDGKIKDVSFEGLEPSVEAMLTPMLRNGGFSFTFPTGPDGLRVGDTIPIEDVMSVEQLGASLTLGMAAAPFAGGGAAPDIKAEGGYTFVGVRMIDGVEAAEFAVDVSTVLDMDMGEQGTMEARSTIKGTQYVNVATGMPIGEFTLDQASRSKMDMRLGGQAQVMSTTATMQVTTRAEALK